jgi:hypothetical protein
LQGVLAAMTGRAPARASGPPGERVRWPTGARCKI